MNTCKQQTINSFMMEVFVVQKPVHLIFSANRRTGFCIIATSVMKDLRLSSSTYTESPFLHVAKHNLLVLFFFYLAFLSQILTIHRTAVEGGVISLYPFYHLPASQTLGHQLSYGCSELTSTHSWQPESNMQPLVHAFQIHSFYT